MVFPKTQNFTFLIQNKHTLTEVIHTLNSLYKNNTNDYICYMKKLILIITIVLTSCTQSQTEKEVSLKHVNINRVTKDLTVLTQTKESRNYKNVKTLDTIASYIYKELAQVCDSTNYQKYQVQNNEYKNVIGSIGTKNKNRIIIGAHYDVFEEQQGADDNASGVAGLLELARLLSKETLNYRIDFVAYTLEEPPFFRTEQMGSYIHANYLYENKIPVKGMICLETIGYFNEEENSQSYPVKGMQLYYGNKGNFITVVQSKKSGKFGNEIEKLMKKYNLIETKSFNAPSSLKGVDFSDHLNYWNLDYEAVMITNTAFFRNHNYHKKGDTLETLDIPKMSLVIEELYLSIKQIK